MRHRQTMVLPPLTTNKAMSTELHYKPQPSSQQREPEQSADQLVGSVIDASLDAVIIADLDSRILRANPAARGIFGEIIGKTIGETIVPASLRAAHERGFAHHVATGERRVIGQRLELEAVHADGHNFPIEIQIEEIIQGERRVFAAFIRDLTAQKAMAAEVARQREQINQNEKLGALATLLGGVAHELNNPLAVVIGRAAILEEALAGTGEEKTVKKLRSAADRCHRIVKTFLAIARQSNPRRGTVDLNELIEGALEFSAYGLRQHKIAVGKWFDPALSAIDGDHDQLVQVFVGLILNAEHALGTHDHPRSLTIRTELAEGAAIVRVEDNGPGLSDELKMRVFEPFFTTKAFGDGGGMGLSVARGIVEAHGGSITFDPHYQPGCAVIVTLPLKGGQPA